MAWLMIVVAVLGCERNGPAVMPSAVDTPTLLTRDNRPTDDVANQSDDIYVAGKNGVNLEQIEPSYQLPSIEGIVFKRVPQGKRYVGTDISATRRLERPRWELHIDYPLYVSESEITWKEFLRDDPEWEEIDLDRVDLNEPAQVSFGDALAYCQRLEVRLNHATRGKTRYIVRLPYEAEWEYIALANVDKDIQFTPAAYDAVMPKWVYEQVVFDIKGDGSAAVAPVKSKKPNKFGVYDMLGNVPEWCLGDPEALVEQHYNPKSRLGITPFLLGNSRSVRGAHAHTNGDRLRPSIRRSGVFFRNEGRSDTYGIRVIVVLDRD